MNSHLFLCSLIAAFTSIYAFAAEPAVVTITPTPTNKNIIFLVSTGKNFEADNTPTAQSNCVWAVVQKILNFSSFSDLKITNVRESKIYSFDGSYLFWAKDKAGNQFNGHLRIDFDFIPSTVNARTGLENNDGKVVCYSPITHWDYDKAIFILKNIKGQKIAQMFGSDYGDNEIPD